MAIQGRTEVAKNLLRAAVVADSVCPRNWRHETNSRTTNSSHSSKSLSELRHMTSAEGTTKGNRNGERPIPSTPSASEPALGTVEVVPVRALLLGERLDTRAL